MRRDLSKGCSSCRLRFSAALDRCPVCGAAAMPADRAMSRVEPSMRAAWIAKWAIVTLLVPSLLLLSVALVRVLVEFIPPKGGIHVLMLVVAPMGVFAGMSVIIAMPLGLWMGIVALLRFTLGRYVDRKGLALRVALDREPRRGKSGEGQRSRVWTFLESAPGRLRRFVEWIAQRRTLVIGGLILFGAEIVAELLGTDRMLETSSFGTLAGTLLGLLVMNAMMLWMAALPGAFFLRLYGWLLDYLTKPPSIFTLRAEPPPILNEELLADLSRGREEIVGRAERLTEAERAALVEHDAEAKGLSPDAPFELKAPCSGEPCLAFRVTGQSGAQPIDDADAVSFAVVSDDQKRHLVRAADIVVDLPTPGAHAGRGLSAFLSARGLPERDISVREGKLRPGQRVRVVGRRLEITVAGRDYRGANRMDVIGEGDGKAVLLRAAD